MSSLRSQINSTFVNVLVVAFFLIIIVVFFSKTSLILDRRVNEDTCRISALAQSNARVLENPMLYLKCPRKIVTIDNKGIWSYFADEDPEKDIQYDHVFEEDEDRKETVLKLFADEMATCWYKLGEGRLNLFNRNAVTYSFPCIVCSQIKFSDDFKMDSPDFGSIKEFDEYLKKEHFTKYGLDEKYYDFMYKKYDSIYADFIMKSLVFKVKGGDGSIQFYLDGDEKITADDYFIYFKAFKKHKAGWAAYKGLSALIDNLPDGDFYYVFFTQDNKIADDCTMIMN